MAKFEIKWQAPEFDYREKDISWYWLSVIIAVILLSAAIWQKNFLFVIFIILAEILILVWANREPATIEFKLDEKGLTIAGKKFYPSSEMDAFGLKEESEEWSKLIFRFRRRFQPLLKIKIPRSRSAEIEKALTAVVKKTEFEDSFLDNLQKFLGF